VPLVLSSILPNREAGLVRPGMTVQVKFDAFPYQDYGMVSGKVTTISPDAVVDEQLGNVYRVEIKLDKDTVTSQQQTISLKAGQTADAEILVRQRRIIELILDPFQKLRRDNLNL
jgi:hemolysin D